MNFMKNYEILNYNLSLFVKKLKVGHGCIFFAWRDSALRSDLRFLGSWEILQFSNLIKHYEKTPQCNMLQVVNDGGGNNYE